MTKIQARWMNGDDSSIQRLSRQKWPRRINENTDNVIIHFNFASS